MNENRSATVRRPKLLLVEDNAMMREVLAEQLGERGCEVIAVDAAEEGIVEVGETAFDAVVSDVHLPGLSGIDLASYLLDQDPGLPVVLITGDTSEDLAREALSRGPVSYLVKPFEAVELESIVEQALTRRGWRVDAAGRIVDEATYSPTPEPPSEWLEFVESESFAGPGHGERVARIALIILGGIAAEDRDVPPPHLALAARTHEVGRLREMGARPPTMAAHSAELMAEAGFPRATVRAVRHMHEHWDGTGGPDGLNGANIPLAARILAVADSIDHYAAAWLQAGLNCDNAVDRAIHLVTVQQSTVFDPSVVGALHGGIEDVREVIATSQDAEAETLTTAAFAATADVPFKVA